MSVLLFGYKILFSASLLKILFNASQEERKSTNHMAWTETGLNMCILLSVDTLKPLWRKQRSETLSEQPAQSDVHLSVFNRFATPTRHHPNGSVRHSTEEAPCLWNRNCNTHKMYLFVVNTFNWFNLTVQVAAHTNLSEGLKSMPSTTLSSVSCLPLVETTTM